MCLVQLMWNLKRNWNSLSRSCMPTCQVSFYVISVILLFILTWPIVSQHLCSIQSLPFTFRVISSWACVRGWGWCSRVRRGRVGVCPGFWKRVQLSRLCQEVRKKYFTKILFKSVRWHCQPNSTFETFLMGHVLLLLTPHRFANPNIVRPYLLLLKSYSKNAPHTNHCIARMLHRLAVDLKMDAILFQLSVFNLFNKILSDPAAAAYKVQLWHEEKHSSVLSSKLSVI